MNVWIETKTELPPNNVVVDTKIDDAHGKRNEKRMERRGRLWFVGKYATYDYYTPTHWRNVSQ